MAETKLGQSFFDSNFTAESYKQYRKDNTGTSGGLFAFVRSEIMRQRRKELETIDIESLCIDARLGKTKWLIVCCYKLPNMNDNAFETCMTPF